MRGAKRVAPQIVAHRRSSADRPENTLASYRQAIAAGDEYTERVAAEVRRHGDPKRIIVGVRSVERRSRLPRSRSHAV